MCCHKFLTRAPRTSALPPWRLVSRKRGRRGNRIPNEMHDSEDRNDMDDRNDLDGTKGCRPSIACVQLLTALPSDVRKGCAFPASSPQCSEAMPPIFYVRRPSLLLSYEPTERQAFPQTGWRSPMRVLSEYDSNINFAGPLASWGYFNLSESSTPRGISLRSTKPARICPDYRSCASSTQIVILTLSEVEFIAVFTRSGRDLPTGTTRRISEFPVRSSSSGCS